MPELPLLLVAAYLSATTTDLNTWSVSTDNDTVHVHLDRSIALPLRRRAGSARRR